MNDPEQVRSDAEANDRPRRAAPDSRGLNRLIAVVMLSVLAVYGMRLVGRLLELERASLSEQRLAAEVAVLEAEVIALETAAAGAGGDAFTERWAREERGWAREGDVPLRIVEATSTPSPDAASSGAGAGAEGEAGGAASEEGVLSRLRRWLSSDSD